MKYKLLVLFCFFSFEAMAANFVQEPANCLNKSSFPCAVRALKDSVFLNLGSAELNLKKSSTLILYSATDIRLLEGVVLLESPQELKLSIGVAQFGVRGKIWLDKSSAEKILVRNLLGQVQVSSPLLPLHQSVPIGFENWYSIINSEMNLSQGILRPIDAYKFLPEWARLSRLSKSQATEMVGLFKKNWKGNVEASANLYKEVVNRELASIEQHEQDSEDREARLEEEREKLREMYKARYREDAAFQMAH